MKKGVIVHNKGRIRATKARRVVFNQSNRMRYNAKQSASVEKLDRDTVSLIARRSDTRGVTLIRILFTKTEFREFIGELMESF
jgi:hypothetical protein